MRNAGILLHISSLPGPEGIGTLGDGAKNFIDYIAKSGIRFWQVLPVNPTGFKDSPYRSFSTFRGNPYFIDLHTLAKQGLIDNDTINKFDTRTPSGNVDYGLVYTNKFRALRAAYENFDTRSESFTEFCETNRLWLDDYAMFMSLKDRTCLSWRQWPDEIKHRDYFAIEEYKKENLKEINFYRFIQYEFFAQWQEIKDYAGRAGVKIIGDLPIYVSDDSSDVWANPSLFQLNEDLTLKEAAGVPPDAFSDEGQLWGNPVYDWNAHKAQGYRWWRDRFAAAFKLYDVVRVDHFRGFDSFYTVPRGAENAKNGRWQPGPGADFFREMGLTGDDLRVIAEDLGIITEPVMQMLDQCGFPGMKVLQFAFSADIENNDGRYLPHSVGENSVIYTGTHDNNTTLGWWNEALYADKQFCLEYFGWDGDGNIVDKLINAAFATRAKLAVIPMQDFLNLDSAARMNTPSESDGNWAWRVDETLLTEQLSQKILHKLKIYKRI